MSELIDNPARERFRGDLASSFSVIAPAGVGKTTAIIDRVEQLLRHTHKRVALVTYTQRAAREMQERLQVKVGPAASDPERLFVGTIHGFCAQQIKHNPEHFGVGGALEIARADSRLWNEFLQENPLPLGADTAHFLKYFYFKPEIFWEQLDYPEVPGSATPPPSIDTAAIKALVPSGRIIKAIENLKVWGAQWEARKQDALWLHRDFPSTKSEAALDIYKKFLGPYQSWRGVEAMRGLSMIARKFKAWRLARGKLTYDDLIAVVAAGLTTPLGLSVILDEAQDTSGEQIGLLQKAARADGKMLDFSMVGDPQQSIYSTRAPLADYWANHKTLIGERGLVPLTLDVTFRCSASVVSFVNQHAGVFLDGLCGQASFVPLVARPQAPAGRVDKITLTPAVSDPLGVGEATALAAAGLAQKIKALGIPASGLHHVAILAPRREWLERIAAACHREGLPVQLHSEKLSGSASLRFLKSLLHLMSFPSDSFELVGLLREILDIDDRVLARAVQETPEAFTLSGEILPEGPAVLIEKIQTLRGAWKQAQTLAPASALLTFIAASGAREALLATTEGAGALEEWDDLVGALLPSLRLPMADNIEGLSELLKERPVQEGRLQLLTMHKAKGLEWDVVILPLLSRAIESKKPHYPRVEASDTPHMVFSAAEVDGEAARRQEDQEFARLLYVSLTRPRSQLIVVDDTGFFAGKKSESSRSLFDIMGISTGIPQFFARLPEATEALIQETPAPQKIHSPVPAPTRTPFPVLVPSALVQHPKELSQEQILGEGGAAYGNWWHELWEKGFSEKSLTQSSASPLPERAARELQKFGAHPLFARLVSAECRCEVPILARVDDHAVEGRLDCVAFEKSGDILVVDWKTDQLPLADIIAAYGVQLMAYRQAMESIFKKPVLATLYSTFHGAWIDEKGIVL